MPGAVGTFKSDHHIVFGVALGVIGVFGLIGSVTGSLAVMLAALFDPSSLVVGSGGGGIGGIPIPAKDATGEDSGSSDESGSSDPGTPDIPDVPDVPSIPVVIP